jgi:flavin-binding protein dodecin
MSDHVYKSLELTGSSTESIEDAVSGALAKANESVRDMRWFEVTQIRGHIEDGRPAHYQVTMKVGFTIS